MQAILPPHMSNLQQFVHSSWLILFLIILIVGSVASLSIAYAIWTGNKQLIGFIVVGVSTVLLVTSVLTLISSLRAEVSNPRQNTPYGAKNAKTNVYWAHDTNTSKHFSYYQDDYLFFSQNL